MVTPMTGRNVAPSTNKNIMAEATGVVSHKVAMSVCRDSTLNNEVGHNREVFAQVRLQTDSNQKHFMIRPLLETTELKSARLLPHTVAQALVKKAVTEGLTHKSSGIAISTEAKPGTTKSRAEALARNIIEGGQHHGFAVGGTVKDGVGWSTATSHRPRKLRGTATKLRFITHPLNPTRS